MDDKRAKFVNIRQKKKRKKKVGTIYRPKNFTFYVIGRFVCKILNALQQ